MSLSSRIPDEVFKAYERLGSPISVNPIDMGLINKTFLVTTGRMKFVLQEISKIFDSTINDDSDAVCHYLEKQNIENPKIYRTDKEELFFSYEGRMFRALKYIEGKSFHLISSLNMAESAGAVLGKFHAALLDFTYEYRSKRRHGGDYGFHSGNLKAALSEHGHHDYFLRVAPRGEKMLRDMERITKGLVTTPRNVHGDPKISNIIFDEKKEAICLVDFDTLGKTGWSLEIADALRSWCNPNQEDEPNSFVDLKIAEATLKGYGSMMRGLFSDKEIDELIAHTQAITLCLAMRFLADVLNERYWAYDKSRFLRPADHNELRARAMHELFMDFARKEAMIKEMVSDIFL